MANLHVVDWSLLVAYLVAMVAFGAWLGRRQANAADYFLGGRRMPGWAVLLSIVATETSTVTFLSLPGVSFSQGGDFRFLQITLGYICGRALVAHLLLPHFFSGQIFTAYEVLGTRLGMLTRRMASLLFVVTRTLADGLRLYLTALVLRAVLDLDLTTCVIILGVVTVLYTVTGGVRAVIYNDAIQFVVYMAGAAIAAAVLMQRIPGGWDGMAEFAMANGKFRWLDFSFSPTTTTMTFWSGLVGGSFLSFASHGADHLMVQRYLSASSQRTAAGALLASGFIVAAQFALFLAIGVGLAAFYSAYPPTGTLRGDEAFIRFIVDNVGVGIVGVILAAVFSAAMSTLSSSLNSSASALVNDFLVPAGLAADSSPQALRWGRLATVAFAVLQVGVAIGTDLFIQNRQVVNQVLAIAGFTTGLIAGLYLLGLLRIRIRESAALIGFGAGLACVSVVAFATNVHWPWYTVVGTSITFLVGLFTNLLAE